MVTNDIKVICPKCGTTHVKQLDTTLVEDILSIYCVCDDCLTTWQDHYGLYYLGYFKDESYYDRDNVKLSC